ncbi:MAG: S8 family serine peptidase [Burkholderiaceae bacterium]|nr:S8 family serine peptidase [Burkholderiaceae bacterium]
MLATAGLVSSAHAQSGSDWAKNRLLVMPRAGLQDGDVDKIAKTFGGSARRVGKSELRILDLPAQASETATLARLAHHPQLKFAELDRRVRLTLVSNDPYNGSEWHVPKIRADQSWDTTQGGGVTIAILDSGVLATHPDLIANLVPGWNFYDNNSNTADVYGHGTAVAGAAAATTNNGTGVAGVAGSAKIMPIRVTDTAGYGYYSTIAQGITYAADHGARVANASFASLYSSSAVQSAAQYLKSKGGLFVVAAGNSGANDGAPATTAMIPVSATDGSDARASWSSFGSYVAVSAPGVGIWTTNSDGGYGAWSGTSFSSPITAGVVALMMAAKPALSASQIEGLLYSTAIDLGTPGRDPYYGYGRIDAAAAVAAAVSTVAADTQSPTVAISAPLGGSTVSGLTSVDVSAADNVGVARVELRVNGSTIATDIAAPYQFTWDSSQSPNGTATVVAYAFDAAGNSKASANVSVNVSNASAIPAPAPTDSIAPVVAITNPVNGGKVSGMVSIGVAASDNAGVTGIKQSLYINGALKASATGGNLSYNWNTKKMASGQYTITAVATDAAGNQTRTSIQVSR